MKGSGLASEHICIIGELGPSKLDLAERYA